MSVFRKINGSMIPVTTEGHQQYYFDTLEQAEQALSQLPEGSDVFVKEGSNEDLLPRVEQAEEDIVQINNNLSVNDISSDIAWSAGVTADMVKAFEQNGYKNINAFIKFPQGASAGFDAPITTNTPFEQYCCACGYVLGTNNNVLVYSFDDAIRLYTFSAIPNNTNIYFSLNGY